MKRYMSFTNLLSIMRKKNNNLLYRMCHMMSLIDDPRCLEGQLFVMTLRYMLAKKSRERVIPPHLKQSLEVFIHPNGWMLWKMI
jgi:hypothetical protein